MDFRLKQIAELLSDVETVCFICNVSGKVIWQNQYAESSDFDIRISDTVYHVFPQNEKILEESIRFSAGAIRKIELSLFFLLSSGRCSGYNRRGRRKLYLVESVSEKKHLIGVIRCGEKMI